MSPLPEAVPARRTLQPVADTAGAGGWRRTAAGHRAHGRLTYLFEEMTAVYCDQPNLGRAVMRALVSGSASSAQSALAYQGHVTALVLQALRGARAAGEPIARVPPR